MYYVFLIIKHTQRENEIRHLVNMQYKYSYIHWNNNHIDNMWNGTSKKIELFLMP